MVSVAIDCMGGDRGSTPIIEGVLAALNEQPFHPILVGDEKTIASHIPYQFQDQIEIIAASDVINMSDNATDALRRKNSSIYQAAELVRSGKAQGLVSAGHSGATMSLATLRIGRIPNIIRPAIATYMPKTGGGKSLVLDVGANVDCKAEHLFQFGVMGYEYAKSVMKIESPRVGLLSNGEEKGKGNEATKEAHEMLQSLESFIGNVEGNNIFDGSVDVIVCDGFVGNIVLKASEGAGESIAEFIKHNVRQSLMATAGALLLRKVFGMLKKKIDYAEYGGAPLLGINGCVIVAHGKSNAKAIKNAIFQAVRYVDSGVGEHIAQSIVHLSRCSVASLAEPKGL